MTRTFRYVALDRIPDYLNLGWLWVADLGPVHGEWSALCEWRCGCRMVDPEKLPDSWQKLGDVASRVVGKIGAVE